MAEPGAVRGPGWPARLRSLPAHHGHAALASLGRLWRGGTASLMSAGVAGISLALPLGLAILVNNAAQLAGVTQGSARISVFLNIDLKSPAIKLLQRKISTFSGVKHIRLVTPTQALKEFKQLSGFRSAFASLGQNPLPPVFEVTPTDTRIQAMQKLVTTLEKVDGIDQVVSDTHWIARLNAMLTIARRTIWVLAGLLALAVLGVIGNTIRLEIESRRSEIQVQKLVGATNAFVRRPFLYGGLWYGATAGLIAWLLVVLSLALLAGPVAHLSNLYQGIVTLHGPGVRGFFAMLGIGAGLGWLGALIALGRHLREVEPD